MKLRPGAFYNVRLNSIFTVHRLVPELPDGDTVYYIVVVKLGDYVISSGQQILDTFGDSIYIGRYE